MENAQRAGALGHTPVAERATSPSLRSIQGWWHLVRRAATAWIEDYAPSMGAALSYYSVFSMAPLLLIVISIAGLVFGEDAVRGGLFGQLQSLLGADAAKAIEALLASVSKPAQGILSTIIGVVVLLVGATTVFGELQDALDRIWRAPARDRSGGLWGLVRARLLSFGMILGIAFLLMVSLVFSAAVAALGDVWGGSLGELLLQAVNLIVGFVLTTAVFALIYKLMPRVHVQWQDVWVGAVVTALLFTVGRYLIGQYIGKSGIASGFGAAGSLIVIFVWVYYSAQIFLVGAEFTWVYAKTYGSMRHLGAQEPAKTATDIPTTSGAPEAGSPAGPLLRPLAAPAARPVAAARSAPVRSRVPARSLTVAGVAVAVVIAAGYLLAPQRLPRRW